MPVELIAAGFVAAYLGIAALGHVLVIAAICKCAREDYFGGRPPDRRPAAERAGLGLCNPIACPYNPRQT